jgi:hypothetical protein
MKTKHNLTNMSIVSTFALLGFVATMNCRAQEAKPSLDSHLEPFRPLLGKTMKAVFKDSKPDKLTIDVSKWERALNGKAVRMTHSINQGVYGGETIFIWDAKKQQVTYYYFTTADYMTVGTVKFDNRKIITHEIVSDSGDGITEVRGNSELSTDGGLHVKAEYFKKGTWVPGHEADYKEDPAALVVFK